MRCYNDHMRLAEKSVVVTGATGIAAAGALKAAREGAAVYVVSRGEAECGELVRTIENEGGRASFSIADLTTPSDARSAFDEAVEFLGGMDGLFAVAGGSGRKHGDGPAHQVTLDAWQQTFDINVTPMFMAASSAIDHMGERGGSIVIVSSVLATSPSPRHFATHAYAAAKGAANSFVKTLAAYYAGSGIRVNGIAPGLVRTPMSERAARDMEIVAYSEAKQPLAKGFLQPEDVAGAAVFLLSDESSKITGQVISVDGGWSVTEA